MSTLDKIKNLVHILPERDKYYADGFIDRRQFESLYELVTAIMIRVKRELSKENPNHIYSNIDYMDLTRLRADIQSYMSQLNIDAESEEYNDESEEYIL